MKREDIEKAARYAINKHYNCGMCCDRTDCEHCYGCNTAYDCQECGADGFKEGFLKGADWRINSVWHDAKEKPQLNKFFVFENEYCEWETDCLYIQQKWEVYVAKYDLQRK